MDPNANSIARELLSRGFEAYFVGGAVRDKLLGFPAHDIDLTTNATPKEIISIFERICTVVPTGILHGTVTLVFGDKQYEVTTYRSDIATDGRHAEVQFVKSLKEDLARRDFTINAIALDVSGKLIDPFNGQVDLKNKVIRTVGDVQTRLTEDYLRMLRAVRFSAKLGFSLDPALEVALKANSQSITNISIERCRDELMKMMQGDHLLVALDTLHKTGLLGQIIPELTPTFGFPQNKYHTHDVFTHMAIAADALPNSKPILRLTGLLHDISKPETCRGVGTPDASFHSHEIVGAKKVERLMQRMKFSSVETERVSNLVRNHMFQYSGSLTDGAIRRLVRSVGLENVQDLIEIKWADRVGKGPQHFSPYNPNTNLKQHVVRLVAEDSAFGLKDLKIDGTDLIKLGVKQGPIFGKILNQLLEKVMDDNSLNYKEKLLALVQDILN